MGQLESMVDTSIDGAFPRQQTLYWGTPTNLWYKSQQGLVNVLFLGILNITFKYLLEIFHPQYNWVMFKKGTFTNPCSIPRPDSGNINRHRTSDIFPRQDYESIKFIRSAPASQLGRKRCPCEGPKSMEVR